MKTFIRLLLVIVFISSLSMADEYAVIANKNMKNLSNSQIKAIFLKKLTLINNIKIVPVNLGVRDSMRLKFEKEILHMGFSRLKAYWTKQHYLGHRPPVSMKSQSGVKSLINKVDGAIGYINIKNIDDSVHVIYKWSE